MSTQAEVLKVGPFQQFIPDAVRIGDDVHLSGAVSIDETGAVVAAGDMLGQMRRAYANIEAVLGHFDAGLDNLVQETLYVTDMSALTGSEEALGAFGQAREEIFGGYPEVAQSLVGVAELVMPDLLIEIEAVARL